MLSVTIVYRSWLGLNVYGTVIWWLEHWGLQVLQSSLDCRELQQSPGVALHTLQGHLMTQLCSWQVYTTLMSIRLETPAILCKLLSWNEKVFSSLFVVQAARPDTTGSHRPHGWLGEWLNTVLADTTWSTDALVSVSKSRGRINGPWLRGKGWGVRSCCRVFESLVDLLSIWAKGSIWQVSKSRKWLNVLLL